MLPLPEPEEVIRRGRNAKALLNSQEFIDTVNGLTNMHLAALCACKPGEASRDAREHHHLMQFALTEIVAELQGYADTGQAMEDAIENDLDSDNPNKEPQPYANER